MKNKIKNIILSILIFLVYYFFPHIINFLLEIFKIDLSTLNKYILILILFLVELIPVLFLVIVYRKDLKEEFKTYKENFIKNLDKYIRLWIFALLLMTLSNTLIQILTGSEISNNEQVVRDIAKILPIYSIFTTCLCAPIGEELAYRKTIGNIFTNKKLAIIMSGFIFGLAHVIGTYTGLTDLLYIIPYGLFGSVFMYIYLESKSIWTTMSIHFMHNALLLMIYYIRL